MRFLCCSGVFPVRLWLPLLVRSSQPLLGVGYLFHARSFHLHKESFLPQGGLLGKILPLGISSLLPQLSIVIIMGVMNTTLVKYGALSEYGADIPMTVVGIVMKVFQIVIAFGRHCRRLSAYCGL